MPDVKRVERQQSPVHAPRAIRFFKGGSNAKVHACTQCGSGPFKCGHFGKVHGRFRNSLLRMRRKR